MNRSGSYSEAHFDAKAFRYQRALRAAPLARSLEVVPFLLLANASVSLDPLGMTVADLLCGSGFLSANLKGCFKKIVGVDISQRMLSTYPVGAGLECRKASLDEQSGMLRDVLRPDVIVTLAGLHHIYMVNGGTVNRAESTRLQQEVILSWAQTIPSHGALILADVTSPECEVRQLDKLLPLRDTFTAISHRFNQIGFNVAGVVRRRRFSSWNYPESISSYADYILGESSCALSAARPGAWFRDVISAQGLYGHVDHFLLPEALLSSLRELGYKAYHFELPTPWLFSSLDDLIFFFYEKFAFGPPVDSFEDIASEIRDAICSQAEEYLGIAKLPGGAVSVGWRLGYYLILPRSQGGRTPHGNT